MITGKRLIKAWIKALRSGKYKQTKGQLYNPATKGFCCLGVLEHVATGGMVEAAYESDVLISHYTVSNAFQDEYGIQPLQPALYTLMGMNDYEGETFDKIADYIEGYVLPNFAEPARSKINTEMT